MVEDACQLNTRQILAMTDSLDLSAIICAALTAEYGEATAAQIGIFDQFDRADSNLPAAQRKFTRLLANTLTKAREQGKASSARILLVGAQLGFLAEELVAQGFHPELKTNLFPAHQDTAPSGNTGGRNFDCVLFAGTYAYLEQLAIFNRCRELLVPGGELHLFGEYLADDSKIEHSSLANLGSLRQFSARLGFQCQAETDLSASALHSVALFLPLLDRHAAAVCAALSLDAGMLQQARDVLHKMWHELNTGRRVYHLLRWTLSDVSATVKEADQPDEYTQAEFGDIHSFPVAEISQLFEKSFEKSFDTALWNWKYQAGDGKCVVARTSRGGEIVAHYGGAPRNILYFGQPAKAIQVCDVMVLPEKRRQYGKSSLFFKVAATFLEREIGNTVNHLLGFGFPNQSAMNIATRLGLYEKTDDFVEIAFPQATASQTESHHVEFDAADALQLREIERLWAAMAKGFKGGIVGVRDAAYIKYRYADHPGAAKGQYRGLLLHSGDSGELLAFVVLKQHGASQLLMDIVCPTENFPAAISAINQLVRVNYPGHSLLLWLTRGWLGSLPLEGAIVKELNIEIPCNSWNPGPAAADLYGKWWLTAGDMDFM